MKTLYIVRHAKSSWDDFRRTDHDRPLLSTGENRTHKVARWFKKKKKERPELIISSTAVRARETAKIIAEELAYPVENIIFDPDFYHADTDDILSKLYVLSDEIKTIMIVGHNMTFNDLANEFLDWQHQIENLPTSGIVSIRIQSDHWVELSSAKSELDFMIFPKMLKK